MKLFIFLSFISFSVMSAECKLTGLLASEKTIETSFQTADLESCRQLAKKTMTNNFFNLIDKSDNLVETRLSFKKEVISLDEANL